MNKEMVVMDDQVTITKARLEAAMLYWALLTRSGGTYTVAEADAMPAEQVASENATYLWELLSEGQSEGK